MDTLAHRWSYSIFYFADHPNGMYHSQVSVAEQMYLGSDAWWLCYNPSHLWDLDHKGDPISWLLMFLQSVGTIEHVSNLALKFNNNKKLALGMYSFGLGTVPGSRAHPLYPQACFLPSCFNLSLLLGCPLPTLLNKLDLFHKRSWLPYDILA